MYIHPVCMWIRSGKDVPPPKVVRSELYCYLKNLDQWHELGNDHQNLNISIMSMWPLVFDLLMQLYCASWHHTPKNFSFIHSLELALTKKCMTTKTLDALCAHFMILYFYFRQLFRVILEKLFLR